MTTFNDWWKTYIADPGRADLRFNVQAETAALDAWEAAQAAQLPTGWPRASRGQAPAPTTAAQPPADDALNTIAAMFLSGEEMEGPDGLAVMVDMSVWNAALDSFEGIIGDEMEPAQPQASLPTVEQVEASMGMGHGAWDMVDPNELIKAIVTLAAAPKASA